MLISPPLIWSFGFDWSINSFLPAADVSFSSSKENGSKWLLQLQSCGRSCYLSVACDDFLAACFDMAKGSSSFKLVYEDSLKIRICAQRTSSQSSFSLGFIVLAMSMLIQLNFHCLRPTAFLYRTSVMWSFPPPCFNHWFLSDTATQPQASIANDGCSYGNSCVSEATEKVCLDVVLTDLCFKMWLVSAQPWNCTLEDGDHFMG